ncbi:hypothetical protein B0H63DRAFT_521572 [Podospora didyma]|uniref:Extracellular membrane protein CFEM domain-containing protein n=1 Tax=Podospora didyma TaxID=330526 RepID=A0AAE0U1V1_9PEZI|nr:hypothetical protein B0H63DRAFT_521572 [Podospora didyma]
MQSPIITFFYLSVTLTSLPGITTASPITQLNKLPAAITTINTALLLTPTPTTRPPILIPTPSPSTTPLADLEASWTTVPMAVLRQGNPFCWNQAAPQQGIGNHCVCKNGVTIENIPYTDAHGRTKGVEEYQPLCKFLTWAVGGVGVFCSFASKKPGDFMGLVTGFLQAVFPARTQIEVGIAEKGDSV